MYRLTDDPNKRGITYIAGPMTLVGPPSWNYPAFEAMAKRLRDAGHEVISPHELHEPSEDVPWDWYLRRDLRELVKCGRVVLLPDFHLSRGARLERHVAESLGMEIVEPHEHDRLFEEILDGGITTSDGTDEVRLTSPTGGQKGSKGARFDQIPPTVLWELAEHYGIGAAKYDDDNWRKGYDWRLSYAALQRHLNTFWAGEDLDPETGSKHVIAAAWHCFALAWFMDNMPEYDSRS